MRPPECAICDKDLRDKDDFELVSFTLTEEDRIWKKRSEEEDFIGHPPWQEWFCNKHYKKAIKLTHLSRSEALRQLRV